MSIDWTKAQKRLGVVADGKAGPSTYSALFSYVAQRRTDDTLRAIGDSASQTLPRYGVDASPQRLAEFLAQTCHETGGYRRFQESMCYSAKRLMQIWPNRFPTLASALPFAWDATDPDREDIALANRVYGARMGNEANGTADNDGWEHRGGGMLQHTGAAEYAALKSRLGFNPDDVRDPAKSVVAACDYMVRAGTLKRIDAGDYVGARRSVNGGTIGLDEVTANRRRALAVLLG